MRQISIFTAAVLGALILAVYGATVITAHAPRNAQPAAASDAIGVMQMMRDAKDLPHQQFDAI